jgi:gp16 family phage-associated protein
MTASGFERIHNFHRQKEIAMNIEQRKSVIQEKLESTGETITTWSKKNKLDHRLVIDLIDGKFQGTRGVTLKTRMQLEEFFGNIF